MNMLVGSAAILASAVPTSAPATPADALLIGLCDRAVRTHREWVAAVDLEFELDAKVGKALKSMGVTSRDDPRDAQVSAQMGLDVAERRQKELDRLDAQCVQAVVDTPAVSDEGIRAKLAVLARCCFYDEKFDKHMQTEMEFDLIQSIIRDAVADREVSAGPAHPTPLQAAIAPDAEILELEEQIFSQREAAQAFDPEMRRLDKVWRAEAGRLYDEAEARGDVSETEESRWDIVRKLPESIESERLCELQNARFAAADELVEKMWAIPATTAEGRRAKLLVLLGHVLPGEWRVANEDAEYGIKEARDLMIEFVGGEPGEQLRDQFS